VKATINKLHLFVGFSFLFLGILYYYLFRPAEHTYFIQLFSINPHLKKTPSLLFFTLGQSLPTFIHVFAFSLLTAGLIANRKKEYWGICLFWFGVNVLFELGQKFHSNFIQFIPDWFSDIVFLENTKSYFLQGRFDYLDIFSIALGAFVAYVFLITTTQKWRGGGNEKQTINCS